MIDKRIYEPLATADEAVLAIIKANNMLTTKISLRKITGAITEINVLMEEEGK